jgi:hypothetical protein
MFGAVVVAFSSLRDIEGGVESVLFKISLKAVLSLCTGVGTFNGVLLKTFLMVENILGLEDGIF